MDESIYALNAECDAMEREIERLEAENTKLRTLLRETLMDIDDYCEKYGLEVDYEAAEEHMDNRLRELEIEVGE